MIRLLSILALAGLSISAGFGPTAGMATYEVTSYLGPADIFFEVAAIPDGATRVSTSTSLRLDEAIAIAHTPTPDGLGGAVWSTTRSDGGPLRVGVGLPNTGLPTQVASVDSSVGVGWPLADGGAVFEVPTQGKPTTAQAAPWREPMLCKARFEMPYTTIEIAPTTADAMFASPQTMTLTVEWR